MVILAVAVLPWTVRNYRAFGQFVLLNTNAGFVFFWGNHPYHGSEFVPILPNDPGGVTYHTLLPRELRALNEAELDRALLARGLAFVRDDPGRFVRLSVSRVKEYFKFWPTAESNVVSNLVRVLSFGLLLPLLVIGTVVASFRMRNSSGDDGDQADCPGALLLLLVAVAYTAVHLVTWTLIRYRLPVDAVMMPFAALAVVSLWQRVSNIAPVASVSFDSSTN
jgi:hypothetical protein